MGAPKAAKHLGQAKSGKPKPAPTVTSQWKTPFLAISLLLALGLVSAMGALTWSEQREEAERLASWAGAVRHRLARRVEELGATLRDWGRDPQLQQQLESGDISAIVRKEADLRRAMPTALAIHVRPRSVALSPAGRDGDLSFAGRDLVRQAAQTNRVTMLEVHRVGRPERHLAIAGPLGADASGEAAGVVYLALPMSILPDTGIAIDGLGQIRYQQRIGETAVAIGSAANGAPPDGRPVASLEVPGTRLTVAAWQESGAWLDPVRLSALAGLYLALLSLIGLSLAWSYRRLDEALSQDLTGILDAIEDAAERRAPRGTTFRLAAAQQLYEQVLPLARRLAATPASAAAPAAGPVSPVPGGLGQPSAGQEAREYDADSEDLSAEIEALLAKHAVPGQAASETPDTALLERVIRSPYIRGRLGDELGETLAHRIGVAIGSEAQTAGERAVYVGHDGRTDTEKLAAAICEGLCASGCDAIELGAVPTPVAYFAARREREGFAVMVTADCEPAEEATVKLLLDGPVGAGDVVSALRDRMLRGALRSGAGERRSEDATAEYLDRIDQDVALARALKIVLDCGRGAASGLAPSLYRRLGCQVIELDCEESAQGEAVPSRDPAQPAQLQGLAERVAAEQADLGLAFDCDADRVGIVASDGGFVAADRVLMLLAVDILSRHLGGDVLFDAASSRHVRTEVRRHGGRALMWRSDPVALRAKARETGAPVAAALRGHFILAERWLGTDDALYASARVLELLALDPRTSAEAFASLPGGVATPELEVSLADGEDARILAEVTGLAEQVKEAELSQVDGLRAELDSGWGIMRSATIRPGLIFRFEADDDEAMAKIQGLFRHWLERAAPGLSLPF